MKTNRWIESSQWVYRRLLHLYPQAYRATYELEMFRVFTDQCREIYKQRGLPGILSLWPRTLLDVGLTAFNEHITDPHSASGLLEAVLDAPLPWKGVLLVLVPGLIFFISQIMQLISTADWFFLAFFRAAYFLILPVLLAWLLTRRFPVWGLIPFGLLYETLWSYSGRVQLINNPAIDRLLTDQTRMVFINFVSTIEIRYLLAASLCAVLLGVLIGYNARRREISHAAWGWLGLYGLLVVFQIVAEVDRFITTSLDWQGWTWSFALHLDNVQQYITQISLSHLYDSLSFLLLVFIGKFFARKYGGLSFLVLLGFLLPTVIYGRYTILNDATPFYLVSLAVLLYRFVVALVAPVWLVRAASNPERQRAAAIPVAIAIISQICFTFIAYLGIAAQNSFQPTPLDFALIVWNQLIIAAGLGLALVLYLPRKSSHATISPLPLNAEME